MSKSLILIAIALFSLTGCAPVIKHKMVTVEGNKTRIGQFTVISSNNVRGLKYSKVDKTAAAVVGEFCVDKGSEMTNGGLQEAVDEAIKNGQAKGIDGDLIVNARLSWISKATYKNTYTDGVKTGSVLVGNNDCWQVEGELVSIDNN